jgi:hypothetical protein
VRSRQVRLSDRQLVRLLFVDVPLEKRLANCLELMADAAADHDLPGWLMFRHLFDLAVLEAHTGAGVVA